MVAPSDCHCHLHLLPAAVPVAEVVNGSGVARWVVNATCEAEWPVVAALAAAWPGRIIPAYGIHPWRAAEVTPGWETRLAGVLERDPAATVGECGLDGAIKVDMSLQRAVFRPQLRLARAMGRTLTIHAVRAWADLSAALAEEPPPARFLLHAYSGSVEMARQLARLGAWFSFNGSFLDPRRERVCEMFRHLPPDRIVIETDAPMMPPPPAWTSHPLADGANHPANLPRIAAGLARVLGRDPQSLGTALAANAARLFGWAT
jgi:TatD DNase family protein